MKYTIIDTKSLTRKSTGERYETKTYSETIDELVDKYPHNDIYVFSKSLNTPNLEVILIPKYRIVERKFDNGTVEYFPQFYNNLKEEWSNISETYIRIIGCGYTDLNKAKECIEHHKLNGEVIKSSYVEKSIYF